MRRRRSAIRTVAVILILLILLLLGGAYYYYDYFKQILADPSLLFDKLALKNNGDVVSIALLGIDSDSARESQRKGYRTDTIVVLAVNRKLDKATAITIPRDTRVNVKQYNSNGKLKSEGLNKINAAFSLGGNTKDQRYSNALYSISELLTGNGKAIDIEKYAGIDMEGIAPLNDAVGGVTVTLDVSINGVGKKGETVKLSGKQAELYCRTRHVGDGSDVGRAKRQQQFILGFAKAVKKMGAQSAVLQLYDEVSEYVDTNLGLDEIAAFASLLDSIDIDEIEFITAPGKAKTVDGASYYIVDEEALEEIVNDVYR